MLKKFRLTFSEYSYSALGNYAEFWEYGINEARSLPSETSSSRVVEVVHVG